MQVPVDQSHGRKKFRTRPPASWILRVPCLHCLASPGFRLRHQRPLHFRLRMVRSETSSEPLAVQPRAEAWDGTRQHQALRRAPRVGLEVEQVENSMQALKVGRSAVAKLEEGPSRIRFSGDPTNLAHVRNPERPMQCVGSKYARQHVPGRS